MSVQLSIYAKFGSKSERDKWFSKNIAYQIYPSKGPVFSWSDEDESGYRDLITELVGALENAQQFIENGIEFGYIRMPDDDVNDSAKETPGIIQDAITKAKDQSNEHKT